MKKIFLFLFLSFSYIVAAQTSKLKKVEEKVAQIEVKCQNLFQVIFYEDDEKKDAHIELSAYVEDETIYKIKEEITTQNAIITSVLYLENDIPVKITTIEENFKIENGEPNFGSRRKVFKMEIFVFDWEKDEAEVKRTGSPVLSDAVCSMYEYESTIKNVKVKLNE